MFFRHLPTSEHRNHPLGNFYPNIWVSEGVEIYRYPVLFNRFRLRAGYANEESVRLDWCCGEEQLLFITALSSLMTYWQDKGPENAFDGLLPHSNVKPWNRDPEFVEFMNRLI